VISGLRIQQSSTSCWETYIANVYVLRLTAIRNANNRSAFDEAECDFDDVLVVYAKFVGMRS
jgi:hypothetical protein